MLVFVCLCMFVYVCVCMCVCVRVCACVRVCVGVVCVPHLDAINNYSHEMKLY